MISELPSRSYTCTAVRLIARIALCVTILAGCSTSNDKRSNGLIITHDGRTVAETAEVAHDEMVYIISNKAANAAGKNWKVTAEIPELPQLDVVHADEWGWAAITIKMTLMPPATIHDTNDSILQATAAARSAVRFRVRHEDQITVTTNVLTPGVALPGSQTYMVVTGDTWTGIANAFYGNAQHWRVIADANPATELTPGITITIPPKRNPPMTPFLT